MKAFVVICLLALLPAVASAQTITELYGLQAPRFLNLSPDGSRLWYQLGKDWWEIDTAPNSKPKRSDSHAVGIMPMPPEVHGTSRVSSPLRSPDGKKIAYLDAESRYGASMLFCQDEGGKPQLISRMPLMAFGWASDSNSFWVIASDVTDQPVGRLNLDGHFDRITSDAAMRSIGGLAVAGDIVAWTQSDGSHFGAIWAVDRSGKPRILFDPNPQTSKWSEGWTQEVVRWTNAHGEELQGVLAVPAGGRQLPLIVDPYSSWQNRFLNIPQLGNYAFVKAGFAVFFPDHRAPYAFPGWSLGEAYVGASKDRDPVDVLTDDVMSGVVELIRRGVADPSRLFLYSSSNGASAIDQLLTRTHAFRAAVSHGGVSDWLAYYRANQALGDVTIPAFLGGKKPEDSLELYRAISPVYQADKITTRLLLVVGDKDSIPNGGSRYEDAKAFYEALLKAGSPVELVVYPGEGHEISTAALEEQHVRKALTFFK